MAILQVIHQESKCHMSDIEDVRAAAARRIHQDEMERIESLLTSYELERANAIYFTEELCARFGANHVKAWIERWATRNGKSV